MDTLDNPENVSQPIDESIPLTKPKKPKRVVTEKQLEAMKAGRELLKQNRELAKAKKILEAKEVLEKYSQPKQEQILPIKPELKIEPSISYQIQEKEKEEKKKVKKALPALKIPEPDDESEEEVEIIYKKKPKKKKIIKYISDSESDDSPPPSPPPQKQKGLQKPDRAAVNKKQLRPVMQSIFCD